MVEPRFSWVPPRARSLGPECVAFWKDAGGTLFEWQEFVLDGILSIGEDEKFTSTNDGLCVARQNGKGVVLQALEVFVAFELGRKHGYGFIMHTAHEFATSQVHQQRLNEFIQDCPHLHKRVKDKGGYMNANGKESINLKDGTEIRFKARTKAGGRGYSGDLLVWDEAMVIPDQVMGAQKPMLRSSRAAFGQKTVYAGSAVDQEVHEYGVNFARLRERGLAMAAGVTWAEWSAPFNHPAELGEDLIRDRELFLPGNPSMADGLIAPETMADEVESMPARTSAVELFNVGDWPRTDGREDAVIAIEAWDRLEDAASVLEPPFVLAFDVSPERATSIALAGYNEAGKLHVEVQECKQGTLWAPTRIAQMCESGDIDAVVCDGVGPAASLIQALEELDVRVDTVNAQDHARACGRLVDMVSDETVTHLGSSELRDAIRGARTRQLGDAWAWSRKNSSVNISPLVAATLALSEAAKLPVGGSTLTIY